MTIDKCYPCYFQDKPKTQDPELLKKYWIPNHPDRKPNPGMLKKAAAEFGLDLEQCWMIGDSLKDVEARQAVGCRTILLSDPSITASPDSKKGSENTRPDFETDSWIKIPAIIQREGIKPPRQGSPSKDTISPFGI